QVKVSRVSHFNISERDTNQALQINDDNRAKYVPCIPYLSEKYGISLYNWDVTGLLFGAKGCLPKFTCNILKSFKIPFYEVQKIVMEILKASLQILHYQLYVNKVHHKFTDTDADPHNSRRGFFFCHIGWLMVRKHPDVKNKGKTVDMSDLLEDPIVVWQMRTYLVTMPLLCFVIPAWIPVYFWGEDPWVSWYVASIMRYTLSLNGTWLVNSAAHMWGTKPYDKNITAVENTFVGIFGIGEGWHNYHHTFPWDYKAAELGRYAANLTTGVIDFFSLFGWAYDLKTVSEEMIRKRSARTGDGSSSDSTDHHDHDHANMVWGWGDKDMAEEDRKAAEIYNKSD
ncbi:hypothetical protein ANN_14186, partial [Periplaneta americana]